MFSTMTNLFSNIQSAEDKVCILLVTNKKITNLRKYQISHT